MPTPIIKGLTTIRWGTGGVATGLTTAVVTRGSFTPKNAGPIDIEDGDGFSKALVLLDDGFDARIECLFDSAITWPTIGATVALKRPRDAAPINCLLASIEETTERKKEATISMSIHYRPGVPLA